MQTQTFILWPGQSKSYLAESNLWNYIIDLWWEDFDELLNYIQKNNLEITWIIITHGHYDHILWLNKFILSYEELSQKRHSAYNGELACIFDLRPLDSRGSQKSLNKCKVFISAWDKDFLYDPGLNLSKFWWDGEFVLDKWIEVWILENGSKIWPFEVKFTPGHTRGSICLFDHENRNIFTGDTLFPNWEWRTDLSTGDDALIVRSIFELSKYLKKWYKIFAGH